MKRLLKTTPVLLIGLFLLASGYNAALDRVTHSPTQSTFTVYNDNGAVVLAYQGDLASCKAINKPVPAIAPGTLHRG